ncbi:DNA repair and recombination protein RadA [[Eubacterium] cellulosolvens]
MTEEKKKIENIEDLEEIGPAVADKLKELGFQTPESLATATVKELLSAGISEKQAIRIISKARESITIEFVRANELMDMKKNVQRLSTGSKTLDELLDSGLETQTITEFYGPYGVGKSILCHQLSVNAQRPIEQRGLNCGVLYIDTEQTFRPEWIIKMANHLGMDPEEATRKIIYCEAYNSDHQTLLLEKCDEVVKKNKIRLIIIDSLTAHFRSEYIGREMLAERQQKLNKHMHRLARLARAFNAVAVVTNQVLAKPDQFFSSAVEAVGGHIVAHTSHTRVYLRRTASSTVRIARLVSSPYLPEGERLFKITDNGIEDVEGERS